MTPDRPPPRPLRLPDVEALISSRVFAYGALATVAVALVLALLGFVLYAFEAHHGARLAEELARARAAETSCQMQAVRLDAQLGQFDKWLGLVREGKRPLVGGVGGGP